MTHTRVVRCEQCKALRAENERLQAELAQARQVTPEMVERAIEAGMAEAMRLPIDDNADWAVDPVKYAQVQVVRRALEAALKGEAQDGTDTPA